MSYKIAKGNVLFANGKVEGPGFVFELGDEYPLPEDQVERLLAKGRLTAASTKEAGNAGLDDMAKTAKVREPSTKKGK